MRLLNGAEDAPSWYIMMHVVGFMLLHSVSFGIRAQLPVSFAHAGIFVGGGAAYCPTGHH